jgi:hypothetical protein
VEVELTSTEADVSNWLSEASAEKLRTFSILSNKYIGCLNPLDQNRWIDFIVTAHQEGSQLHASTFRRWLTEIEDWSPQIADQLINEYALGGTVLAFSDSRCVDRQSRAARSGGLSLSSSQPELSLSKRRPIGSESPKA